MARIKDLIAAIITTGNCFEEVVRIITAASYSAESLQGQTLAAELNFIVSQDDIHLIRAMAAQGVVYKKIHLKSGMPQGYDERAPVAEKPDIGNRTREFLHELQIRDELNYPFAVIASQRVLLLSAFDLEIIMAIAREQQLQADEAVNRKSILSPGLTFPITPAE